MGRKKQLPELVPAIVNDSKPESIAKTVERIENEDFSVKSILMQRSFLVIQSESP